MTKRSATAAYWLIPTGALLIMLLGDWAHGALSVQIRAALSDYADLRTPLTALPKQFGPWSGDDLALDPRVLQAGHFDDDHVNRMYLDGRSRRRVGAFIGYVGRPRARMGHRPDVCFAAHGWTQTDEAHIDIPLRDGGRAPGFVYEFRDPRVLDRTMMVLAVYLINGSFAEDPNDFGRWNARTPNLVPTNRPAFLARIQLSVASSGNRAADRTLLADLLRRLTPEVTRMLPYWNPPETADDADPA